MFAKSLLFTLILAGSAFAGGLEIDELTDIPGVQRDGEEVPREVSGATWHQGEMWIVDNEDDGHLLVMDPKGTFQARKLPAGAAVSDLEGITSDGKYLYVMAGGGLSKSGKLDPARFTLARLEVSNGKLTGARVLDQLEWLKALGKELDLDFEKAKGAGGEKVKVIQDVKLEGLAMTPGGHLLVGLRKPLVKDRSLVIDLQGYEEAFDTGDASLLKPKVQTKLELEGAGVSSLEHDPITGDILVLAIHPGKLKTDFWLWGKKGLRKVAKLRGHKAEGVARAGKSKQVLILADDEDPDGTKTGRYTHVELP